MKSPCIFLFPILLRLERGWQGFFWHPPNLPNFFSFPSVLECWRDGYSYWRKLKLNSLKIILYSLNVSSLLCQHPWLWLKFLQAWERLCSRGDSKWMQRERKMIKGFQVDNWFIGFKHFFFSCLDIALLFSNLFFSCLIFPQLWQYSWSQMWVHYLKMPAVEAGKQVGEKSPEESLKLGTKAENTSVLH